MTFRSSHTLEKRLQESARIRRLYPSRVPVLVEKRPRDKSLPVLDKCKFLVPNDLTVGQFIYIIRKRMNLAPEKALFMFVNGSLPVTHEMVGIMYDQHKGEDNFLEVFIAGENCFGAQ